MLTGYRLRDKAAQYAKRMAALSHTHRLSIVHLLAERSMPVRDIASCIDIAPNLALHHIGILIRTGWIRKEGAGRVATYHLANRPFGFLVKFFADTPEGKNHRAPREE